jgi:hypothetical protein
MLCGGIYTTFRQQESSRPTHMSVSRSISKELNCIQPTPYLQKHTPALAALLAVVRVEAARLVAEDVTKPEALPASVTDSALACIVE